MLGRSPGFGPQDHINVLVHVCNPNIQKVRAAGPGLQGHPVLHSKFKANLGYIRPEETEKERDRDKQKETGRHRGTERYRDRNRDKERQR